MRPWVRIVLIALVILLGVVFTAPIVNSKTQQWVECDVISAEPVGAGGGGLRGSGGSRHAVEINTKNCGAPLFSDGINGNNVDAVASSFKAGSKYEIKMGWWSRQAAAGYVQIWSPTATEYRLIE